MLTTAQRSKYLGYIVRYKTGARYQYQTPEYNEIVQLERQDSRWTALQRTSAGVNVPSLTYIEQTPLPRGDEQFFSTSTQPQTDLNVGLPPGTTPTENTTTTTTTPTTTTQTSESFISKYKMPLIIGGVGIIAYLMFKKK